MVVDGHVVGVGVVFFVGDSGYDAELFAVAFGEFAGESFGWCGEYGVVVLVFFAEFEYLVAHVGDDAQSELLCFGAFAVVVSGEGYEAFGQSDESDAECALVDDGCDGVVFAQYVGSVPEF